MINIKTKNIILRIIKVQLFWYLINFLTFFFQNQIPATNLGYIFEIYLITFQIVARSLFISVLLYLATMIYQLNFANLGVHKKNIYANLKLGIQMGYPLLFGFIIINLVANSNKLKPLFQINNLDTLSQSLFYFLIIFICYLIPAFSKELFFRGFISYQFNKIYSPKQTFCLTVIYYTASHFDLRLYIILINFIIAIITTYLYYKTDSLVAGVIFQAFYKAAVTIYLFAPSNML